MNEQSSFPACLPMVQMSWFAEFPDFASVDAGASEGADSADLADCPEDLEDVSNLGDPKDHPRLFEFPSLFYRRPEEVVPQLAPCFSSVRFDMEKYRFEFLNERVDVEFFPLDNPPKDESAKTSLRDARKTQNNLWNDGFCPLDYFALMRITDTCSERDAALLEKLHERYGRYLGVYVLFSDPIHLGESPEDHYLVWEVRDGFHQTYLTVMSENKLFSLLARETVLTACIPRKDVIMKPEFELPTAQPKEAARVPSKFLPTQDGDQGKDISPKSDSALTDWELLFKENRRKRSGSLPVVR